MIRIIKILIFTIISEVLLAQVPFLYINEFMASNNSAYADEYGEFDDWIEVYNAYETPVWLGNKYLTDNLENPDKWQMPDTVLQSGAFIVFWADNQPWQGVMHTDFKLSEDGDEIGIFDSEETGYEPIDNINYGSQSVDLSYGRNPDGGSVWKFYIVITPGFSNTSGAATGETYVENLLHVYPNPVLGDKVYFDEKMDIRLYNATGELMMTKENTDQAEINHLLPGLYLLTNTEGRRIKLIIQ